MGWQQYTPQHNPQIQYGFQSLNAGQYQYSFPIFSQQGPVIPPNSGQIQQKNAVEGLARGQTEEDKAEKIRGNWNKERYQKRIGISI